MDNPVYDLSKREYQLCLILWQHQPIACSMLVELCHARLEWSKSTTYTYLSRLEKKGILNRENSCVRMLVSQDEIQTACVEALIESTFEGSASDLIALLKKCYLTK
jgi:predicted transcriptional regulator